ncbi:MAG: NifB/NifX family molybdenum-iron cluster-binding protein [Halanaerobiales bacterium]|nr:NifB/NifX family molybdenum-iron cluster-binding protein [Halanaerobiales bacterium]
MKIVITSQGATMDAEVDPRFGRCAYFMVVDLETENFEAIENPAVNFASGAGIKSGSIVADQGAEAVLTGRVGPKASQALQAGNVKIYCEVSGTIAEVVKKYKKGEFKAV